MVSTFLSPYFNLHHKNKPYFDCYKKLGLNYGLAKIRGDKKVSETQLLKLDLI